jgi:L-2-hydroxyglutarate oxidase LhgO
METANVVVVGAGIVGLAVAAQLSENTQALYILEENQRFGQETSSHNSGVVHSGIHYPTGTLKAELCVKGNAMTYKICEQHHITHKKLGKLTVAVTGEEIAELERLRTTGEANGVDGLRFLGRAEVQKREPGVEVEQALHSPSTGIVEPDELMYYFYAQAQRNGAVLVPETEVTRLEQVDAGYELHGVSVGERFSITATTVINCAGLHADKLAALAGLDIDTLGYRIHYCKGDYFRVAGKPPVQMLVYPVPQTAGLGIHLTPDLGGSVRLGPNAYYVEAVDYEVQSNEQEFRDDVARYLPLIRERRLQVDSAGVRPKLQGPNDVFRDFVIRHEADRGLFGFINLVGIESPGLTAAPAIAELVAGIYDSEIKK